MFDANLFFETLNWAWSFGLTFMVLFLTYYLWQSYGSLGWKTFFFDRPEAEQFAIAILVADFGANIVRVTTAVWRTVGADLATLNGPTAYLLLTGSVIGTAGILCKLRIVSTIRFGNWPWLSCAGCIVALVLYQYLIRGN